jgi:hypothetical protein
MRFSLDISVCKRKNPTVVCVGWLGIHAVTVNLERCTLRTSLDLRAQIMKVSQPTLEQNQVQKCYDFSKEVFLCRSEGAANF